MATTPTTHYGWRKPAGTPGVAPNPVSDIGNLADDSDGTLYAELAKRPVSANGVVTYTSLSSDGDGFSASKNITFPGGRFASPPVVTTGIVTGASQNQHAGIQNVTASGFTLYYYRDNNISGSAFVNWIAQAAS